MATACEGLRVLDLTQGQAGGVATMILSDFGAEVLKIEPPDGDRFRGLAAAPMWLRGKQSLILDLKTEAGVARLHALCEGADVVVTSFRPGAAQTLGADYETLSAINPLLIYCSITGWGARGSLAQYRGYEGLVAARSGRMLAFAGQIPRPGPVYAAVPVGTHAAAQAAVQGILAALLVREQIGRGQLVQTSLLQGMLPYDLAGLIMQQLMRRLPDQFAADPLAMYQRLPTLQYQPLYTHDGRWIQLGGVVEHLFHAFIASAGLADIYADPRFSQAPRLDDEAREALRLRILERGREHTLDEWMQRFIADGNVAAEPIASTHSGLDHVQARENGTVVELESPRLGRMRQIGAVGQLSRTPARISPCFPEPGEHDATAVDRWLSDSRAQNARAAVRERPPRQPLEGVTVIEFATVIATPLACSLLADMGARVVKVEATEGDPYRHMGNGVGASKTNAGKESICLDLKSDSGRSVARRLVERADVLVHNFRPGVPERLGIGYEQVCAFNPQIVYVGATGYGPSGPHAHRPSSHPIAGAAMGGVLWQAGAGMPPDEVASMEDVREYARRFYRANEANPDPNTSMVVASAVMLALYARQRHSIGQQVQTNMLVANAYANFDDFVDYAGKPERPLVDEGLHGLHALYRLYETRAGWIFLACPLEEEWPRLCRAAGCEALLSDARFASAAARRDHDNELIAALTEAFRQRTADEWEVRLTAHDLGCVRADAAAPGVFWDTDEHVWRNGFVREAEHLRWGPYWRHGPLVTFSETPGRYGAGILAGQQTRQLLRELGYEPQEIDGLYETGAVATETP